MFVRRCTAVAATAVLLLAGMVASPPPVQAHTDACAVTGTMATPALLWPGLVVVPPAGPMAIASALGACATTPGLFGAVGTIGGWCGYAWGSGFAAGHFFVFTVVGSTMVLTGAVTGVLQVVPNVVAGESCTIVGADGWLVTGAVTLAP